MFDPKSFLKQIFLFANLEDGEILELSKLVTTKNCLRNEVIFRQGDKANAFYILVYGKAKISKVSKNGDEQIIHFVSPFDLMAEAAIFDEGIFPGTATALDESLVVKISRDDFVHFISKNPKTSFKMMASYSRRLRGFVKTIENLTQKDTLKRVIHVVLTYLTEDKEGNKICDFPYPKKELAAMYNMTPETFSRNLSSLKKKKIIKENSDKTYTILDLRKLKEL